MTELNQEPVLLWKDRKRILGMPISFTRYMLKNGRIFLGEGFFTTRENELLLYRILDISMKRTLMDKLLGVGTLTLFTVDESNKHLLLKNIRNPEQIRDLISAEVEKERERLKISGREIFGASDTDMTDNSGDGN